MCIRDRGDAVAVTVDNGERAVFGRTVHKDVFYVVVGLRDKIGPSSINSLYVASIPSQEIKAPILKNIKISFLNSFIALSFTCY